MIPDSFIQEVLERTDITQLISEYIPLKKSGANFKALCPFHSEKTPSFFVSPSKQIFHCFGCGKGGNAIHFLMEYEKLSFYEALEILSKRLGLKIPIEEESGLKSVLFKVNEFVCSLYQEQLGKNSSLLNYLSQRGLKKADIEMFRLGFAPSSWDFILESLRKKNIPLSLIEKAGLIVSRPDGGFYDLFRNRLIIPIMDIKSRVIGFGARRIGDDSKVPKYINSPETDIYHKRSILYGLNFSKDSILKKNRIILVEGYFDVLVPFSRGIKEVVAPLGTSLTPQQARIIKRYTDNIIIIFDKDKAGLNASLRALSIFLEEELFPKITLLPEGEDPASFLLEHGLEDFELYINQAQDFLEFYMKMLLHEYGDDLKGKKKIFSQLFQTLAKIENVLIVEECLKKVSRFFSLREEAVFSQFQKFTHSSKRFVPQEIKISTPQLTPEKILLAILLKHPYWLEAVKRELSIEDFSEAAVRDIMQVIYPLEELDKGKLQALISQDTGLSSVLAELEFMEIEDEELVFREVISRISLKSKESLCKILKEKIRQTQNKGNMEEVHILLKKYKDLKRVIEDEKKKATKGCRTHS